MWLTRALAGELPLPVAFWLYGIAIGTLVNVLATGFAFMAITLGAPDELAAVIYILPLPYDVVVVVAVWNSAGRWTGDKRWATAARAVIVAWLVAAIVF